MNVRNGLANGNDESSVREQFRQILDARDVVVPLRQVTLPAAQSQDLAQVRAERVREVGLLDRVVEHMNAARIVQPIEVTLPKRLFECFRTLRGDLDAICVNALLRALRALIREAILEPVPQKGDLDEREIAITVGGHAIGLRQQRQQDVVPERARPVRNTGRSISTGCIRRATNSVSRSARTLLSAPRR